MKKRLTMIVCCLGVLGVLLAVATVFCVRTVSPTKDASLYATRAMIEKVRASLDVYRDDVGRFPSEEEGLAALVEWHHSRPHGPSKDARMPHDAWGNDLRYGLSEGVPSIVSSGPDGIFGTLDDIE